ncbi:MAG: hypothetical protein PHI37_05340 [Candidatus Gracilibacteria bacterium]|nr:hypothetical protein [Candidatus Gracilibacteria bacterium]
MYIKLKEIFQKSNEKFLENETSLILSGVSERSLCGKLSLYITDIIRNSEFSNYHVDTEYNRNYGGNIKTIINSEEKVLNITCDIIIHSRGENINQDNLIAIEMKKSTGREDEKQKDRDRLIALTKELNDGVWTYGGGDFPKHVCGYILGIYYEVNIEKKEILIEEYRKGKLFDNYIINF